MKNKNIIIYTFWIAILTAISLFIPNQENIIVQISRMIFWSIFILFIPGYLLTLSFFEENEIDLLERFALSFALSISVVPLLSFYLNLIWIKINELSVYLIVVLIILGNLAYINFIKNRKWKTA